MNETYPNISVNSVRLSSDSCALEEEGASTKSAESPRGERERSARASKGLGLCFNSSPESFSARVSGTLVVYELSATVIHLVARHAFAADISVRVCGKKLSPRRDKKNPNATSDEFSRLENFSLIGDTQGGRDIGMKKGGKKK